jgi:hypothetical protein
MTATKPSKPFQAMVKYSSLRPWRTIAERSRIAVSAMSAVYICERAAPMWIL